MGIVMAAIAEDPLSLCTSTAGHVESTRPPHGTCTYGVFALENSSNAAMALAAYISDGPPPM